MSDIKTETVYVPVSHEPVSDEMLAAANRYMPLAVRVGNMFQMLEQFGFLDEEMASIGRVVCLRMLAEKEFGKIE